MTVNELIIKLNKLEPDLPVIVSGYEGGYCDVTDIEEMAIILNANSAWYYGPHESADNYPPTSKEKVNAIYIS